MSDNNSYPSYYKKINISETLQNKKILTDFGIAIDLRTNSIVCDFNHKYQLNTKKVIGPIDIDDWTKFIEKTVKKKLGSPPIIIDVEDAQLIQGNLDQEFDNIVNIVLENKNNNNSNSDYDNNQQEEKEDEETEEERKSLAQVLVELVLEEKNYLKLFKDEFNVPHIIVTINDHYQTLPINSPKFKRYLSKLYYDNYEGRIANTESINSAVSHLEAKAFYEGQTIPLHLRVACAVLHNSLLLTHLANLLW